MPGMPGTPGIAVISVPAPGAMAQPPDDDAISGALVPGGAAAAQLCGTDIAPTRVARPTPAETADPPRLDDPSEPIAEPTWAKLAPLIAAGAAAPVNMAGLRPPTLWPATAKNPISANALVTAGLTLAGLNQLPERNPFDSPELMKLPKEDLVSPSSMFKNPAIPVVAVFVPGAKGFTPAVGAAMLCRALGSDDTTCDSVDCTPAPDDVPVA